jgi:hypothetical protein
MIKSIESFEKVDRNMIKRWMKPGGGDNFIAKKNGKK